MALVHRVREIGSVYRPTGYAFTISAARTSGVSSAENAGVLFGIDRGSATLRVAHPEQSARMRIRRSVFILLDWLRR